MFYHLNIKSPTGDSWLVKNKSKDQVLNEYVCPFINNETTILSGEIYN